MKKISTQHGFNLVELVFVIMIIGILSVVASRFVAQSVMSYLAAYNVTNDTWQSRLAYSRFMRDVRQIRSPTDITNFTNTELTFVDMAGNTFDYVFNGTTLMLNGYPLADNMTGGFSYFDVNINAATAASAIVYVTISLTNTKTSSSFSATAELRDFNL